MSEELASWERFKIPGDWGEWAHRRSLAHGGTVTVCIRSCGSPPGVRGVSTCNITTWARLEGLTDGMHPYEGWFRIDRSGMWWMLFEGGFVRAEVWAAYWEAAYRDLRRKVQET